MNIKKWQFGACCIVSAVVGAAIVLGGVVYVVGGLTGSAADSLRLVRTMQLLKKNYNGEVETHQLFDGALKGMVEAAGDPYTVYLDKKDFEDLSNMTVGSFGGVGIVFGKRGDDYVVISALENTPSAEAGVKSGDVIIGVDGEDARKLNMEQVANKIRGEIGTQVTIQLQAQDGSQREVTITRTEIKTPSVGSRMLEENGKKIGYLRIAMFNENTGADFDKAYKKLEEQGMQATILDLRGNPGGILSDGVAVAGHFVPKGPIVSVVDKHGNKFEETSSLEKIKYPLAVLVDHGSASASEIVAGAIKDTKAGKLFGVKTFGKGSVQSVYRLDRSTAVKITTAKYYTPSGVSIHNVGIEPDVVVELPERPTVDTQLNAAKEYLVGELAK